MSPALAETPVAGVEWLARYILDKNHFRADGTVKQNPFIPFARVELSVTRHMTLNEDQLWAVGELVAQELGKPLYGRADAQAITYVRVGLRVVAKPLASNANHADVIDWPPDKPSQKILALLIAKEARFKRKLPPL